MKQLKAIIIEDEESHRAILEAYCQKSEEVILMGSYASIVDWSENNPSKEIDLIFMDIGMPEISGIDYLRSHTIQPQVIFITLNQSHAVEAFEYDVTDYIIKPYTYSRFLKAIEKAQRVKKNKAHQKEESTNSNDAIFLNVNSRLVQVNASDIIYLEADGNFVKVHLKDQSSKTAKASMSKLSDALSKEEFVRCHRKFVVRLESISEILNNDLIINNQIIPMSRMYKKNVLERLRFIG